LVKSLSDFYLFNFKEGLGMKKTPLFEFEVPIVHRRRSINWDEPVKATR
jgi:hypothetical protein